MTTDEFHGHLMAALHGPHAAEIATRVAEVAAASITPAMAKAMGEKLAEMMDTVETFEIAMTLTVAVLADAHVQRAKGRGTGPLFEALNLRKAAFKLLRASARAEFGDLVAQGGERYEGFAAIFED